MQHARGVRRQPLVEAHDLVMFDLDGVVYVGGGAIDGVADHIDASGRRDATSRS